MATLADVQASITGLTTSISAEIAEVTAAIKASQAQNAGAISATDADGIVASLNSLKETVDAETAAVTPPAPPAA